MAGKTRNKKALPLDEPQKVATKIGKHLKSLRVAAGYKSSLDFAIDNHIHPAQYARYEAGTDMRISTLVRLASFHKLTIEEFFKGVK